MGKLVRYVVTGLIATGIDFGLFAFLVKLAHWPWFIAGCLSFVLSILVGYLISIRLVFTSGVRFQKRQEITLVFLISAIGLALNQALLFALIRGGSDPLVAKAAAAVVVVTWNFVARSRFVFTA